MPDEWNFINGEPTVEIRPDASGAVDDVVIRTPTLVRLERMDKHAWWLEIQVAGEPSVTFDFSTDGRSLDVTVRERGE